jgi:hypothetical protein
MGDLVVEQLGGHSVLDPTKRFPVLRSPELLLGYSFRRVFFIAAEVSGVNTFVKMCVLDYYPVEAQLKLLFIKS